MSDEADKREGSAALRLLKGVAGELRDLAIDTARFGETLASDAEIARANRSIGLLQRFDIFAQNLEAHARLIDDLSARLENGSADLAALHDLIGLIPFFGIRERLRTQMIGNGIAAPPEEISDEHWF